MKEINYQENTKIEKVLLLPVHKLKLVVFVLETENGEKDYVIIGKVDYINSSNLKNISEYIEQASKLIYNTNKSFPDYIKTKEQIENLISLIKASNISFTQEGFDLATGKALFTEGVIERTLYLDTIKDEDGDLLFGNNLKQINHTFAQDGFAKFEDYLEKYFVTAKEYKNFPPGEFEDFIEYHKERLLPFLRKERTILPVSTAESNADLIYSLGLALNCMQPFSRQLEQGETFQQIREENISKK